MSSIKDKFGTDWIGTPYKGAAQTLGAVPGGGDQREVNQAFLALGKQIYRHLKGTNGVDKLYNLAEKMSLEPQDIEPAVAWMASLYYIKVEPDTYGNHEIQLTSKAEELIRA